MKNAIIIGASHAAAQLVVRLYKEGWDGTIMLVGEEPYLPYHRPPLSKALLAGEKTEEQILIRPKAQYEKIGVILKLGRRAIAINRNDKTITLDNGEQLAYDKLALTVGARVRKINIPGSALGNIFYLRNIADVHQIKVQIPNSKKAVIIGGGYIGLEAAAVLRKLGLEVTVLEMMDRVLQRVTTPEVSAFYTRIHREEGVSIYTQTGATAFEGNTKVQKVVCTDGQTFEADFVVVGIGVIPNTELAKQTGLTVQNGIVVDKYASTSDPDIVAAGDCTFHPNALLNCSLRLESVQNASDQATTAAATICGKEKPYQAYPWFWSDQYDVNLQIAGLNKDYDQVLIRGNALTGRKFIAFYLKKGKLIAADCINSKKEYMFTRRLLDKGITPTIAQLKDEDFDLKTLL